MPSGTVGYTTPEIVKDERYSMSGDMCVLGCVDYTLLHRFPPFYDESISVLVEKVDRPRQIQSLSRPGGMTSPRASMSLSPTSTTPSSS